MSKCHVSVLIGVDLDTIDDSFFMLDEALRKSINAL